MPIPIKIRLFNEFEDWIIELDKESTMITSTFNITGQILYSLIIEGFKETPKLVIIDKGKLVYSKEIKLEDYLGNWSEINIIWLR